MEINNINWPELKEKDYLTWRSNLWIETQKILTSYNRVELSQYNELGYFHKIHNHDEFKRRQREWQELKRVPQEWIGIGAYPGIWTAMFSPHNTFSLATPPILIARFYFKKGYFVFDVKNPSHKEILKVWLRKRETEIIDNPWKKIRNFRGECLEEIMKLYNYPYSKKFFEDNCFGVLVGYSDYIAVVIVLEDSIQEVEFSVLR